MAISKLKIEKKDLLKEFEKGNQKVIDYIIGIEQTTVNESATKTSILAELQSKEGFSYFQYEDDGFVMDAEDMSEFLKKENIPHTYILVAGDSEIEESENKNIKIGDILYEAFIHGEHKEIRINKE